MTIIKISNITADKLNLLYQVSRLLPNTPVDLDIKIIIRSTIVTAVNKYSKSELFVKSEILDNILYIYIYNRNIKRKITNK